MQILENFDLTTFNTFGVKVYAKFFVEIKTENEFLELIKNEIYQNNKKLFLGGGSNILFTKDFDGLVILNKIKGIGILKEEGDFVWIKSFGGEVWHDLVLFAVERNYWGMENLSLIPGSVGASPVQNIGAYGAELKNITEEVVALDVNTGEQISFKGEECEFGYRDSIFKNKLKDKYFILAVIFKLKKISDIHTEYKVLDQYVKDNELELKTAKDISEAVSNIRRSKLPDPKILGNAGSFFKNVYISHDKLANLLDEYPEMPYFNEGENIKIPTAWLIETLGFKGKIFGKVGVHDKQSLILVNHGGAEGKDIKNLAYEIIKAVKDKFGIEIFPEVNII